MNLPAPRLIDAWLVPGTRTVFWLQNMRNNHMIRLVQEGDRLTAPLSPDQANIGLGIFNGNSETRGIITYIAGQNLWEGGSAVPSKCETSHMWVIPPATPRIMDAMMSPNSPTGRPFVVTPISGGYTIAEATGANEHAGTIQIFERLAVATAPKPLHGTHSPFGELMKQSPYRQPVALDYGNETYRTPRGPGGSVRSFDERVERGGAHSDPDPIQLDVGLQAPEFRPHAKSTAQFHPHILPVATLVLRPREEFLGLTDQWEWRPYQHWYHAWSQHDPDSGLVPQVPIAPQQQWQRPGGW